MLMENKKKPTLWTKNFTILSLGTVVSTLGNAVAGFAISLIVLDYTGSTLLYAVFAVVYNLPKVIMPFLAGPYLDRFSRAKMIYTLDFISSGLYLAIFVILRLNLFNYAVFLALCLIIGSIDGIYQVAYDSLYPMLITPGFSTKAYSVSSMIYPLASVMVLAAAWCYEHVGLNILFLFNAATFLIAAAFETQIKVDESQIKPVGEAYNISKYVSDFKEGVRYIKAEKGLMAIAAYFTIVMFSDYGASTLALPFFKSTPGLGVKMYTYVMGCAVIGRVLGGLGLYKHRFKPSNKFNIALSVYLVTNALAGILFYSPIYAMCAIMFITGLLGVTSYNIRISATQSYVPNDMRGRFTGVFQMLTTLGGSLGSLITGAVAEFWPMKEINLALYLIAFISVFFTIYLRRNDVKKIYCMDVDASMQR